MDLFKKSTGFLLFFIAIKLTLAALPKDRLLNVLMYGVIFSFCVWMWGKWVDFSTPPPSKWTVRAIAVPSPLAPGCGCCRRHQSAQAAIDWQPYDAVRVQQADPRAGPSCSKFTADWCTNCKVVERRVYHDPDVAGWSSRRASWPSRPTRRHRLPGHQGLQRACTARPAMCP